MQHEWIQAGAPTNNWGGGGVLKGGLGPVTSEILKNEVHFPVSHSHFLTYYS